MVINNGFNILPWYDSLEKQSNKKWYAFGQSWPLACPQDTILPFQFVSSESISIKSALTAVNLTTGVETNLGITPTVIAGSQANANYYIVKQPEAIMKATLQVGRYYFKMDTDKGTLYSEEVVVVDNISDYIKLEYWNENTLNFMSGEINFADSFKFVVYIPSTIGKPEYEFEEELTKRLGYKFIESQTSNKLYKFNFLAPEYICDALRLVRMCDYIKLTTKFDTYNALSFSYEPKWQDAGYLAAIDVEFDTDCIIQKLESFNRRAKDSFYNALLAEIDEPVLFSPDTVAQYYTEFTSTTVVNGKLIRQLELINEVELRTDFDNIVLPIDNQADPSQKAKKITLTDLQKKIGDGKYLRKDKDDRSVGRISTDKGFEAGRFVSGFLGGTGVWIGADGYAEMTSLTLRESLRAPDYIFNRVDVVSGELWNAPAFGTLEDVDTENMIASVRLESNERCGLHVGDFCRGIFADFGGGNNWEGEDECGFMHLYGFWTSYFTPTVILDNEKGLFRFKYELKPDTTQHPTKNMKFAVYGNPNEKSRQASAYSTRTYKRYLNNVTTWVIDPDSHIYAQYGDLNGLQINGVKMQGYGSYQSNAYFRGVQIQLPPEQMESLKGDSAYAAQLTSYVGTVKLDANGNILGGISEETNVTALDENGVVSNVTALDEQGVERNVVVTTNKLTTTVQAYKGTTPLYYSAGAVTKGSFTLALACVGCTASVVNGAIIINSITDTKDCRINITVNCEGMAVYNLEYNVAFIQDGKDGQPGSPGQPGDSGKDAVSYRIEPNIQTISKTMTGTLSPESVKFKLQANKGGVIKYYQTLWSLKGRNLPTEDWTTLNSADRVTSFDVTFTDEYKYYELSAKTYGDGDVMLGDTLNISIVADGKAGDSIKGDKGAMPRYRGEFVFNNESEPYVYDGEYRDIVIYEGNVYQVYMYGSSIIEPPSIAPNADNDGKWQRANKFRFVAMDTALIDSANIGGFMFKRTKYIDNVPVGKLESQYGPVVIREVSSDNASVAIEVESGNGKTTVVSRIVKTKGNYAYTLKPTTRLVTLDKDNNPSVSSVSCSLIRKSVSGDSSITSIPDGYTLKCLVTGEPEIIYTPNTSITIPRMNGATIVFQLLNNQSGDIVSQEIVYVFSEESTQSTILYDRYIQFACNDDGSVKFGLPYRFHVSQWQGGKEVPLTNIDLSGSGVTIDNERIELDAETGTMKCTNAIITGEVNATSGVFKNIRSPNGHFKIDDSGRVVILGTIETSMEGKRIVINPETQSIEMYDDLGRKTASMSFKQQSGEGWTFGEIDLFRYIDNSDTAYWTARLNASRVEMLLEYPNSLNHEHMIIDSLGISGTNHWSGKDYNFKYGFANTYSGLNKSGYFANIYSDCWPTSSQVGKNAVYLDGGTLKVKQ